MNLSHLLFTSLCLAVAPSLATAQNRVPVPFEPLIPTVGLCTHLGANVVGDYDELFQCAPRYDIVSAGQAVTFDVYGAVGTPYVLFAGMPVLGCQPIGPYLGMLAVWAPITTVQIGFAMPGIGLPGDMGIGSAIVRVPNPVPAGFDLRFQAFGVGWPAELPPALAFSRAIELRTR